MHDHLGRPTGRAIVDGWCRRCWSADQFACVSSLCLRGGTSYVFAGSFWGRRPEAIAAENGEVPPRGIRFHTPILCSHHHTAFAFIQTLIGISSHPRNGTSPGGKEGRRQAHKNIMPYRPIYLWEITVNKLFTAVTSSWDSSPWPANGRRAHRPAGTVGPVTRGRDI